MPCRRTLVLALVGLLLASCTRSVDTHVSDSISVEYRHALEHPDKFELLTVACEREELPEGADGTEMEVNDGRRGFTLVDSRVIEDESVQEALVNSLYKAIEGEQSRAAACFDPHHGIRATNGDTTVTILVCFICHNFRVYPGGGNGGREIAVKEMKVWRDEVQRLGMLEVAKTRLNGEPP